MSCWRSIFLLLLIFLGADVALAQQETPPAATEAPNSAVIPSTSERAWLAENHTVRARVADYPPYMLKSPAPTGIAVDYLASAAKRFGFKVEFLPDTTGFSAAVQDVSDARQHYDLLLTFTRTPEREKEFAITTDFLSAPWVVYARKDSPYIVGLESLSGKTAAVEKGFVITQKLKSDYPAIHFLEVATSADALIAVATGKADAYVGNLANASYLIKNNRLDNLVVAAPTPYGINTQAMAIRKDWPELAGLIDKSIAAMTMEERNAINQKWGSIDVPPHIDYAQIWQVILIAGAIVLGILYWNRKRAEKAILASEALARTTMDAVPEHICVIDSNGVIITVNQAWRDFYDGNRPGPGSTHYGVGDNYLNICESATGFNAEGALGVAQGIRQVISGQLARFECEYACDSPSERRTFNARVVRFHGETGNVLISHENITERKQALEAIRLSEARLNRAELASRTGNWELHVDGQKIQASLGASKVYGLESGQFALKNIQRMVLPEYRAYLDAKLKNLLENDESYEVEYKIRAADTGEIRDIYSQAVFDRPKGILFGIVQDITERKKAEQELERLAQTDVLTGLANRRHFMMLAEQELSRTARYGGELSVLMLDIDHFKCINDTYGHQKGDLVIQLLGTVCRATLRDIDVVGRVGGEEFAIALPQTAGPQACEVAERLRQEIEAASVPLEHGMPLRFTVSIGVATLPTKQTNLDTLLGLADKALYDAKNSGRNRVSEFATV